MRCHRCAFEKQNARRPPRFRQATGKEIAKVAASSAFICGIACSEGRVRYRDAWGTEAGFGVGPELARGVRHSGPVDRRSSAVPHAQGEEDYPSNGKRSAQPGAPHDLYPAASQQGNSHGRRSLYISCTCLRPAKMPKYMPQCRICRSIVARVPGQRVRGQLLYCFTRGSGKAPCASSGIVETQGRRSPAHGYGGRKSRGPHAAWRIRSRGRPLGRGKRPSTREPLPCWKNSWRRGVNGNRSRPARHAP